MPHSIIMPKAEMAMEEGSIIRWLIQEGDLVTKSQPLLEIETDKSTMEVESEADGTVLRIIHPEGARVPVAEVIGWIGEAGEDIPEIEAPAPESKTPEAAPTPAAARSASLPAATPIIGDPRRIPATPAARRLARERGVDLATIYDPTRGLPLRAADIPAAEAEPELAPGDTMVPLTRIQQTSARRMVEAHSQIPAVTIHTRADVTELDALRARIAEDTGQRITYNDGVLAATARVLPSFPELNAEFHGDRVLQRAGVHLAFAVAADQGLLAPVLRDADQASLSELAQQARALAEAARDGGLDFHDLEGGTFTVSNVGKFGVTAFNPIINLPQVAILGVCAVETVPRYIEDRVEPRRMIGLSLTFDHRAMDGITPSRFLQALAQQLEQPADLLESSPRP